MMRLTKENIQRMAEEPPLTLFKQGIKSPETLDKYTRTLRYVLCTILRDILDGDFEQRVQQLVTYGKTEPKWTLDLLLSLSRMLRERTELSPDNPEYLNPVSFGNFFKPIKKLFDMNDVYVSWKRVNVTYPELDNVSETYGWTKAEIQKMLKHTNGTIDKVIILIAASSGIRAGGFNLNWGDIAPIYVVDGKLKMVDKEDENNNDLFIAEKMFDVSAQRTNTPQLQIACAMLQVYSGTSEKYITFITPEAYSVLLDYRQEWIQRIGRHPKSRDPILLKDGDFVRRATAISIKKRLTRILNNAGLRDHTRKNNNRRFDVPMMNGFRRFWNKSCKESYSKESHLSSLIKKEYMMGHRGLVKLDRNYFKTNILELAEEYMQVIPNLTIDDSIALRETNRKKDAYIQKMKGENYTRIQELERMVSELYTRLEEKK